MISRNCESVIVRESHGWFFTNAGPEIGVASTKAFTTQLVALQLLVLALAVVSGLFGVVSERWLFFAEARHVVTLFYGRSV